MTTVGAMNVEPLASGSRFRDGIYYSKRPLETLPEDPYLDWTTYAFDHPYMDRVAVVDAPTGECMTFRETKHLVYSMAAGLAEIGVLQGDVVMLLAHNSMHYPVWTFAIAAIGAVVTTVNPASTSSEIAKQVQDSDTKFIITSPLLIGKVIRLQLPLILVDTERVEAGDSIPHLQVQDIIPLAYISDLYRRDPNRAPRVKIRQTDTAILLYSSGTTGAVKGVKLTHGNAVAASAIYSEPWDNSVQRSYVVAVPFYHVYGMMVLISVQLRQGSKLVVMPKFELRKFFEAIERYKVTFVPTVPPIMVAMVKTPLVKEYDLTSIQIISTGAAPSGPELLTACANRFKGVIIKQGYGMTETTGVAAATPIAQTSAPPPGSVGVLTGNFEAKIVDVDSGQALPPLQRGEIWLRGPSVMQGYLNNEKATSETKDNEGWLHTGDVGYFDDDGYLFIVDRLKELIKFNGLQVAPAELEAILLSHPQIADAGVIGLPDERTGEIPAAFVVRSEANSLSEEDVKKFVAEQVAPHKKVRKVFFVKNIPKSPSGKILRRELRLLQRSKL